MNIEIIVDRSYSDLFTAHEQHKMDKHSLSPAQLRVHMDEQIGALQRTAQLYDDGYQFEAQRMAVILRVLLHSKKKSPSLLERLEQLEIEFVDTGHPYDEDNLLTFHCLISIVIDDNTTAYEPTLDQSNKAVRMTLFKDWWQATIFVDGDRRQLSRSDVVLTAANQDGGAHVDPTLRKDYAALRHENSLGWTTGNNTPISGDPVFAAIRQIAHEVLKTFVYGYYRNGEEVRKSRNKATISENKMLFFSHEERFYQNKISAPLVPGIDYLTEIKVDNITTGSVMVVVNSVTTEPVTQAGIHRLIVKAGDEQHCGVFGKYTDAVIDCVSIRRLLSK